MKRKLINIARQLTDAELQELIQLRKVGDKRVVELRKKRDKAAAELAKLNAQIAKLTGSEGEAAPAKPVRRGRGPGKKTAKAKEAKPVAAKKGKPGRKPAAEKTATVEKKAAPKKKVGRPAGAKRQGKMARGDFSAAVRDVFAKAGGPLRAKDVVDGLPGAGVPVSDVAAMRKRISVVLASQKNHFEQTERGVYRLKK